MILGATLIVTVGLATVVGLVTLTVFFVVLVLLLVLLLVAALALGRGRFTVHVARRPGTRHQATDVTFKTNRHP